MRVMLPDGSIRTVSRDADAELFHHVVGGYGLFAVILDAELDVVDNVVYQSERRVVDYRAFDEVYTREIAADQSVGLMYGHLSTSPGVAPARDAALHLPRRGRARRACVRRSAR